MNDARSRAIKSYFSPFPSWTIGLGVAVVVCIACQGIFFAYGLGWVALAVAGWTAKEWFKRPSDKQMDIWTEECLDKILPRALDKCHFDASQQIRPPVMFTSLRLHRPPGAFSGAIRGHDQRLRFTPLHTTVVNFTEHELAIYQCALDLTTGQRLNEGADEYFYKDVVSVATESRALTLAASDLDPRLRARFANFKDAIVDGKVQLKSAESFVLTTSGATSVRVVLRDPVLIEALGGGTLPTDRADEAIRTIRAMVRIKKAS